MLSRDFLILFQCCEDFRILYGRLYFVLAGKLNGPFLISDTPAMGLVILWLVLGLQVLVSLILSVRVLLVFLIFGMIYLYLFCVL